MIDMRSSSWASFKSTVITKKSLYLQYSESANYYDIYASDGPFLWSYSLVKNGEADVLDFETNYKALANQKVGGGDLFPFAIPTHRTKRNAVTGPEITGATKCLKNASTEIKMKLTQELFASGGCLIIKNADFGDYVTAEVEDHDSIIPAAYRPALCEAWPLVSSYIEKEYIEYKGDLYTIHKLDTKPLAAKISSNLYLCLHYFAINTGIDREVLVNYSLSKKL
jgi:hypothetical protein